MHAINSKNILTIQSTSRSWSIPWPLSPRTKNADDATLIAMICDGSDAESRQALETVYVRHHKDIWRYVRSRVSSDSDADEVAAAVWLVVIEKIHDFVWTGVPIKSWLFSIAYRKIKEFFNAPTAISLETIAETQEEALQFIASQLQLTPEPALEFSAGAKKEADQLLHQLIGGLSAVERQIIMLIYFENLENSTEVANRLGMNKNTIRVYHKRARDKLRASPELSQLFEKAE